MKSWAGPGRRWALPEPASLLDRWQRISRRIRVPLGFVAAIIYVWELFEHKPSPGPVGWSLLLVLPGLLLRAYASGYVKKNRELTTTGPYAYTRNPLYLGSILIAAGFALALMSWAFALTLAIGFIAIYIPVIASEEKFLRATFAGYDSYCQRVPRLIPRFIWKPRNPRPKGASGAVPSVVDTGSAMSRFSLESYRKHREYNSAIGAILLYCSLLLAILGHSILGR